jgi:hypothetical protein
LIDDNPEITGANKSPEWEQVFYTQSYNKDINKKRISNWDEWEKILK